MITKTDWIVEVNQNDELVGKMGRETAHNKARLRLHREVMILLYSDRARTSFLLQKRSLKKEQWPGYWTLSATGHVDWSDLTNGDTDGYLSAARREIKEEIGIEGKNLKLIGKIINKNEYNWSVMGVVTGEFEGKILIDKEEVSEVGEFSKETIVEVSDKLTPGARACLKYLKIL